MRKEHSLYIGEDAAENIKIKIGTASQEASPRTLEVKGRNVITGLPKVVTLTSEEIRIALKDATNQIVETVHGVLEKTPPELAADIVDRGIVLSGGGAMLHGMDTLIEQKTGVAHLPCRMPCPLLWWEPANMPKYLPEWKSNGRDCICGDYNGYSGEGYMLNAYPL